MDQTAPRGPRSGGRPVRAPLLVAGALLAVGVLFAVAVTSRSGSDGERIGAVPVAATSEADRRMHERLAAIADASDVVTDTAAGVAAFGTNRPALIPILQERSAATGDPTQRLVLEYQTATEIMLAGRSREALLAFETLPPLLASLDLPSAQRRSEAATLQGAIGLAALRLGEQENCLLNHRAGSCLFPIDRSGVHLMPDGSTRAAKAFAEQLALDPDNLGARWLLNLAHMTVGTYPDRVPARWLIPRERFESEFDIRRFADVAAGSGLDVVGLAGGTVLEDFDGDGDLDVMASSWGVRDQLRLFRNDGASGFVDRTGEAGLIGEWGGINLTHADYDNDGRPDVFVHRGGWLGEAGLMPNSLLRNTGDGRFSDVTEAAGLYSEHPTHAATWGDFDNDGFLDLFVGNEDSGVNRHPVQLYRNRGDGTFEDVAPALGLGVLGMVKGAAWGDHDNDGWLDLYVSRFGQPNLLYHNEAGGVVGRRFREVAKAAGVSEPLLSFATWFWDYDNDGSLDLFVGGWSGAPLSVPAGEYLGRRTPEGTPRLFHNRGDGTFEDVTTKVRLDRVHLAMGANFGDLDNDGYLDVYLGTGAPDLTSLVPNRMFRNAGGRVFQDVTTAGGFGHVQKGHAIAFGDLDNDGDQDVYAVMGGWFTGDVYQNALFENPGHGNHWVSLALEGTRTNRMGVGARIAVRVATPRGARTIHRVVTDGGSFGSSSFRQDIGVGDATAIEAIDVLWPASGQHQVLRDVGLDRFIRVREGERTASPVARPAFTLGSR